MEERLQRLALARRRGLARGGELLGLLFVLDERVSDAFSADDRALLEVATVIRAATRPATLAPDRQRSIIEGALRQAIGGVGQGSSHAVVPLARARQRRWVPWAVAGTSTLVAAAAVLLLWLRPSVERVEDSRAAQLPASWTSRPADPLIGPIDPARSGDASGRIDTIFADRLDGYRERRLSARGGKR